MRLWMKLGVVLLVLAGVGAGAYFFVVRRGADQQGLTATPRPGLPAAPGVDLSRRSELSGDDDNDGLSNADELAWGTDPLRADTDGDGYLDGEEVRAGHDPRIPAPNDKLDDPGATQQQIAERRLTTLAQAPTIDPYLSDDVSLQQPNDLTQEYERAVPAAQRSSAALAAFVQARPVETLLPRPAAEDITAAQPNNSVLLDHYLAVAQNDDVLANPTRYLEAQHDLQAFNDPSGIVFIAERFRSYRARLLATPLPEAAIPVQTLLLAYTAAQAELFDQIAEYPDNPAKSQAATLQAETLDQTYFPLFQREFARLEDLQGAL